MVFDFQQAAGGIIVFPDWVYSALPVTTALEETPTITGTTAGTATSIGGSVTTN